MRAWFCKIFLDTCSVLWYHLISKDGLKGVLCRRAAFPQPHRQERIIMDMFEYYGFFREEDSIDRLTVAETKVIEYLFDKYLPKEGRVIDTCTGWGTFAFRFADMGYTITAGDWIADHVEKLKANPKAEKLAGTYCSSPKNLSMFADGSFDIVVSLGSMYHMKTRADRETFIRESLRVLTVGGYLVFSFMTPMAMTLGQYFNAMRTYDADERIKAYRKLANVEKQHSCDMFYGMTLEEMTDISREYGLDIVTIASTYGMLYNMVDEVEKMSDEQFEKFIKVQYETCEDPFVSKYCMRGVFIGKKKPEDLFD